MAAPTSAHAPGGGGGSLGHRKRSVPTLDHRERERERQNPAAQGRGTSRDGTFPRLPAGGPRRGCRRARADAGLSRRPNRRQLGVSRRDRRARQGSGSSHPLPSARGGTAGLFAQRAGLRYPCCLRRRPRSRGFAGAPSGRRRARGARGHTATRPGLFGRGHNRARRHAPRPCLQAGLVAGTPGFVQLRRPARLPEACRRRGRRRLRLLPRPFGRVGSRTSAWRRGRCMSVASRRSSATARLARPAPGPIPAKRMHRPFERRCGGIGRGRAATPR